MEFDNKNTIALGAEENLAKHWDKQTMLNQPKEQNKRGKAFTISEPSSSIDECSDNVKWFLGRIFHNHNDKK